jgi:hypothetical protein
MKLQREILEAHKKYKGELERVQQEYGLAGKMGKYFPEEKDSSEQGEEQLEKVLEKVEEKLKHKRKELGKWEHKIEHNGYLQYLANLPADIEEMNSSEEEDIVEELPPEQPRLHPSQGSYSQAMPSLKDKKHSLNLRRTYEVFRDDPRPEPAERQREREEERREEGRREEGRREEGRREEGENRVTINNRLKDFLLS